jgi:hypothetical protein
MANIPTGEMILCDPINKKEGTTHHHIETSPLRKDRGE